MSLGVSLGEYANSLLHQAKNFDKDEGFEESAYMDYIHIGIKPMLLALSMELALKAWYAFENDCVSPVKTHYLTKLFKKLKIETQEQLDKEFKKTADAIYPSIFEKDHNIRDFLEQHADAFIKWRYLHEYKGPQPMTFNTSLFIATVEMILREFKKCYNLR